jgi:hypothetical protein
MMEWLTLLILVPAIVIPIVILFGFAGCGFTAGTYTPTVVAAPVLKEARAFKNEPTIRIEWTDSNTDTVEFEVERVPEGPGPGYQGGGSHFHDTQLTPGDTYSYRVRAKRTYDGEYSEYSETATAVPWANAFNSNLSAGGTDVVITNTCVVQRFDPGSLARGGNRIAVTLQALNNGLRALAMTVSAPAPSGDAYDSQMPLTLIAGPFDAGPAQALRLEAAYDVQPQAPILIAFDIDTPGHTRFASASGCTAYTRSGVEAHLGDRSQGFTPHPGEVWAVTSIDVATEWP